MKSKQDPALPRFVRDVGILLSTACGLFYFLALVTYQPSDPSLFVSYRGIAQGEIANMCGLVGAFLADATWRCFGYTSYLLPIALSYILICALTRYERRRTIPSSMAFLIGLPVFIGLIYPTSTTTHDMPASGYFGAYTSTMIFHYMGAAGGLIFVGGFVLVAFVLATGLDSQKMGSFLINLSRMSWYRTLDAAEQIKRLSKEAYAFGVEKYDAWTESRRMVKLQEGIKQPDSPDSTAQLSIETDIPESVSEPGNAPIVHQREEHHILKSVGKRRQGQFKLPDVSLLDDPPVRQTEIDKDRLVENAKLLENKLKDFGIDGRVTEVQPGPVITMYEYKPAAGIKVNRIVQLSDDLAMAMSALSVRIVAPIPGKSVVGVEISNQRRESVLLKEVLFHEGYTKSTSQLTLALGKDIAGNPVTADLRKMPHLLVAGATGSGKSVGMNAMILSILFRLPPQEVRFLMIDPKMLEFSLYEDIPHLIHPVVTDPRKAALALKWVVGEMERRYKLLAEMGVRKIEDYNRKLDSSMVDDNGEPLQPLPYILVAVDELADLMIVSGRDVEESLTRLAQMARASGIHLILATQRPSVDVLTGIIKANFPARISFQVASKTDSRTVLDTNGAEKLLGAGDMLFLPPGSSQIQRIHGAFVSEDEIGRATSFLRQQQEPDYLEDILNIPDPEEGDEPGFEDEMYGDALEIVRQTRKVSISMIQRKLRIGYNRAARMVEQMESEGIVSKSDAGRPREVLM